MSEERRPALPLTRADLDRVIRRAAELQFQEGEDDPGALSEEEVLRIGGEVGLEPAHVRRAIGEIRAEALVPALPPDRSPMRRLLGEGRIRAERVVPGEAHEIEERLVRWLTKAESLVAVRRRAGTSIWEPAEGFVAQLQRGLKWGGQRYQLAEARQVELSVQPLEEGYALVTMTLDVRNVRAEQGGGYLAGFGGGAGALAFTVAASAALPPIGLVAAAVAAVTAGGLGGLAAGRHAFETRRERLRLEMEGLLDRLERGALDADAGRPRGPFRDALGEVLGAAGRPRPPRGAEPRR